MKLFLNLAGLVSSLLYIAFTTLQIGSNWGLLTIPLDLLKDSLTLGIYTHVTGVVTFGLFFWIGIVEEKPFLSFQVAAQLLLFVISAFILYLHLFKGYTPTNSLKSLF